MTVCTKTLKLKMGSRSYQLFKENMFYQHPSCLTLPKDDSKITSNSIFLQTITVSVSPHLHFLHQILFISQNPLSSVSVVIFFLRDTDEQHQVLGHISVLKVSYNDNFCIQPLSIAAFKLQSVVQCCVEVQVMRLMTHVSVA